MRSNLSSSSRSLMSSLGTGAEQENQLKPAFDRFLRHRVRSSSCGRSGGLPLASPRVGRIVRAAEVAGLGHPCIWRAWLRGRDNRGRCTVQNTRTPAIESRRLRRNLCRIERLRSASVNAQKENGALCFLEARVVG